MKYDTSALLRKTEQKLNALKIDELKQLGLLPGAGKYAITLHYPPLNNYPLANSKDLLDGLALSAKDPLGLYLNIPFCINRCHFCHYVVTTTDSTEVKDRYLNALEKELRLYREHMGIDSISAEYILVGGGTPTHLSVGQLQAFLEAIYENIDLTSCQQFTFDVDPTTLLEKEGLQRLRLLKGHGVDRLTIGVQSLDDRILAVMNRAHNARDVFMAIDQARRAGFENLCADLIYGYPGQGMKQWIDTVEGVIATGIEEIEMYQLNIVSYASGESILSRGSIDSPIDDNLIYQMRQAAVLLLEESGYHQNIGRGFSKNPDHCSYYLRNMYSELHNTAGFGLTSFSCYEDRFMRNARTFKEYYALLDQNKLPMTEGKILSKDERLRKEIILPLKRSKVDKNLYLKRTGQPVEYLFKDKLEKLVKHGLLEEDQQSLALTERGNFFADQVCQQFFDKDFLPFPETDYMQGELIPYG